MKCTGFLSVFRPPVNKNIRGGAKDVVGLLYPVKYSFFYLNNSIFYIDFLNIYINIKINKEILK
jgi:hypothetical protein